MAQKIFFQYSKKIFIQYFCATREFIQLSSILVLLLIFEYCQSICKFFLIHCDFQRDAHISIQISLTTQYGQMWNQLFLDRDRKHHYRM